MKFVCGKGDTQQSVTKPVKYQTSKKPKQVAGLIATADFVDVTDL